MVNYWMVEVFALKLNRSMSDVEFESFLRLVSEEKKERILRFHRYKDSQMALIADVLVRKIMNLKYDIPCEEVNFSKGINGKPRLSESRGHIEFNYSHSGEWVVCAVSATSVGIDVEKIKDIDFSIAERFFAKSEYDDLKRIADEKKLEYFYDLWTLKESYVKWDGRGLIIPLHEFAFRVGENGCIEFRTEMYEENCYFKQYIIENDYKVSVCASDAEFKEEINILNLDQFIEKFKKIQRV